MSANLITDERQATRASRDAAHAEGLGDPRPEAPGSRDVALAYLAEHGRLPGPAELARLADVNPSSAKQMLARLRAEQTTRRAA
jgi:hypothetical protein